jgi:hypothetical protein
VEEKPLYSGEKCILLKTINNQNNHRINQALLVLKPRLNNTNSGCVTGSESHAYRLSVLPTSKESKLSNSSAGIDKMPQSFVMTAFNKCVETLHILFCRHTTEEIEQTHSKWQ